MSRYTTQLRFVIDLVGENEVKSWFTDYTLSEFLTEDQIEKIEEKGTWSKDRLAEKIINHYYTKEIGFETVGLFKHYAKVRMKELMEEYLPLIYSASIQYDPLVNVDFTETFSQSETGNATTNSQASGSGLQINSDTPQGQINKSAILNGDYATSTQGNESTSSGSDTTNSEGTTNYTRKTKGNSGVSATAQRLVLQYRDTIRAIDREITEKVNDLFMGLY